VEAWETDKFYFKKGIQVVS